MKATLKATKKLEAQDQFVGIDVSKKTLDVYVRPSKQVLRYDIPDAIDLSNAIAAMKCRHLGAREGIPRSLDAVEQFRREPPRRGQVG